jgi:hypothetical protein
MAAGAEKFVAVNPVMVAVGYDPALPPVINVAPVFVIPEYANNA